MSLMRLPGYDTGSALLNLNPLNQAIQFGAKQQQRGFENDRALTKEKMTQEQFDMAKQDRKAKEFGNMALAALQDPDPVRGKATFDRMVAQDAEFAADAQKHGLDLNDWQGSARTIAAKVGVLPDPQKQQFLKAQIDNLNRREDPDIVRAIRAAGVDPKSEQGKQLILNSLKGGDPISQAIANQLNATPPSAPQSPVQSPIQPQSFDQSEPQAGVVLTQAGGPPPAQPPQQNTVDVPGLGQMPKSRAELLSLGLALQGKGDAGKMIMEGVNAGKIGKEGTNELDKTLVSRALDLGELENISRSFDRRYLGLEGQAKGVGLSFLDWASSGKLSPENTDFVKGYTKFSTSTIERLNNRIKAMSGATVTGQEADRMNKANPTLADGPNVFQEKLNAQIEMHKLAIARANWVKREFKGTDDQIAAMAKSGRIEGFSSIDGMKDIINQKLDNQAKAIKSANPGIDDLTLRQQLKAYQRQEFGI